jgi:hypothetical protein
MRYRLVREFRVRTLFGLVSITYKVHAYETLDQYVQSYSHVIHVRFWWTLRTWHFDDALPRYELPMESHES